MDGPAGPGLDYANLMLSLLLLPHMPHYFPMAPGYPYFVNGNSSFSPLHQLPNSSPSLTPRLTYLQILSILPSEYIQNLAAAHHCPSQPHSATIFSHLVTESSSTTEPFPADGSHFIPTVLHSAPAALAFLLFLEHTASGPSHSLFPLLDSVPCFHTVSNYLCGLPQPQITQPPHFPPQDVLPGLFFFKHVPPDTYICLMLISPTRLSIRAGTLFYSLVNYQ